MKYQIKLLTDAERGEDISDLVNDLSIYAQTNSPKKALKIYEVLESTEFSETQILRLFKGGKEITKDELISDSKVLTLEI